MIDICTRMDLMKFLLYLYDKNRESKIYGLEIGFWKGDFDMDLLSEFPNLFMTVIDKDPKEEDKRILEEKFGGRFRLIEADSNDAFDMINQTFDFIFIDGDHSYEQNRADILNYTRFVKLGGIISGHNFNWNDKCAHPGVKQSTLEIFGDDVTVNEQDVFWWVIKQKKHQNIAEIHTFKE